MSESSEPAPESLRVLTINIWNRSGPWEARLSLLREGIAALRPDLVALQEVLALDGAPPDQAEQIADGLGYHVGVATASEIGGGLRLCNGLLSRFPLSSVEAHALPNLGGDEPRGLLSAVAHGPAGDIPVFVTHLNWKLDHGPIRQRQVRFIVETIDRLAPSGDRARFPAILAGDFNAEPGSDEIRYLTGGHALDGHATYWNDCHARVGEGPGFTFVPSRNGFAAETHEPDRRIDYVFVRLPDASGRGRPLHSRVVLAEARDGVWPSDHFGVYAELSVGAR